MSEDDHSAINVRFFLSNPGGTYDPVELYELDMINATVVPAVGDFVYGNLRMPEAQVYRVLSRHFDPQSVRFGIMVEKVEAIEDSPYI